MKPQFLVPTVTAFDPKGRVDEEANLRIYDRLIAGGVDGIVLLGSIGEFYAIPMDEQKRMVGSAARHIGTRCKLIVGTSAMRVEDCIELSNYAHSQGVEAVMTITPYYFDLSDASVELFYDRLAASTPARVYLYNFPARTGYDLKPSVALKLARKHSNIVGYKDSIAFMGHTRELANTLLPEFPEFEIYSGFDENLAHNILSGGAGCIGGLGNVDPALCAAWLRAILGGDCGEIARCQRRINRLMRIYDVCTPFIPAIKQAMVLNGFEMTAHSAFPLLPPDERQVEAIRAILTEAQEPM